MNTELLLKIRNQILAEPENFQMEAWRCGSTCCIAGWAVALNGNHCPISEIETNAIHFLDIPLDQATALFHCGNWPEPFKRDYRYAPEGSAEAAEVAAERIDHFIATGE